MKGKGFEGTDANVYISLMDRTDETERIWLNKKSSVEKGKNLFEPGQRDVFAVHASLDLNPERIRIGHDNSRLGSGWHLKKVVLTRKHTDKERFTYLCNGWLAKDEGNGEIERVLEYYHNEPVDADERVHALNIDGDERGDTLTIPIKHDNDEKFEFDEEGANVKSSGMSREK